MARIIRTRLHQPTMSPGMVGAAILLVLFYKFYQINLITVLICVFAVPLINALLVGRTHKEDVFIDEET